MAAPFFTGDRMTTPAQVSPQTAMKCAALIKQHLAQMIGLAEKVSQDPSPMLDPSKTLGDDQG